MIELAVIPKDELDGAIAKVENLVALFNAPTDSTNALQKKEASQELAKIYKLLESKRVDATKPALEEQRRINGFFKPVLDKLESVSKGFIGQVNEFVKAEKRKEEKRRLEEAKAEAERLLANKPPEPKKDLPRPVSPNVTVSTTKVWTYEVVDLDKVPREYLTIYDYAVDKAIKAGARQIPGLKIYQDERVSRR
jgi:hypothetical protein